MQKPLKTTVTGFVFHDNKLLLIKHKKSGKWLHVGGHSEKNETLDETLEREIKEEVNLNIRFMEEYDHYKKLPSQETFKQLPRPFYIHAKDKGDHRRMAFDFLCIADDIENLKIREDEIDGFKWFTREELQNSPEITEPIKILALKAFDVYKEWK